MPRQNPQQLPTAEVNFKVWSIYLSVYYRSTRTPQAFSLDGSLSHNWKLWLTHFDFYLAATEKDTNGDKIKISTFLTCIDQKRREIYETFTFETGDEKKLACYNPINTSFLAVVIAPVPFFILTSYSLHTKVILILLLIVVFSFEKCSNGQNHSSSGFHHPIKNPPSSKISDFPHSLMLFGKHCSNQGHDCMWYQRQLPSWKASSRMQTHSVHSN